MRATPATEYGNNDDLGEMKARYAMYVVGSKSFRPDIQKQRQMENAVMDI